jgi:site-specific DNA-methyltransferase (adenine-specific)
MIALPRNTIIVGDARNRLRELPADSVDCVITSPPYFAVRDYGHSRQIGHEANVDAGVSQLRTVFAEVERVLKPNGALWLNLGDGCARELNEGAPRKSLLLAPERVALALSADGWLLRNKVIWAKTNPMPSSIRDRLSCTYEVLYFLTRSKRYFFDLDAIRAPHRTTQRQTTGDPHRSYPPAGTGAPMRPGRSQNSNSGLSRLKARGLAGHPLGKNPGDVWALPTAGYRGAHFATFPVRLIERPLLATCPSAVCAACGKPMSTSRCGCQAPHLPGLVLDPFLGSGTVAVAAEQFSRDWLGIELNPMYAELARARITTTRPHDAHAPPL